MDRSIGSNLQVPPATLQALISITVVLIIPIYDRVFIPIASVITGNPLGITMLQRIGFGIFFIPYLYGGGSSCRNEKASSCCTFWVGGESKNNSSYECVVLIPQYVLFGISDVFTMVGLQEFFYDQVLDGLRSLGLALYLSIFGVGSFLISIIENTTSRNGQDSWFSYNLNRAHLDYFYWLLALLCAIGLAAYLYFAASYIYKHEEEHDEEDLS